MTRYRTKTIRRSLCASALGAALSVTAVPGVAVASNATTLSFWASDDSAFIGTMVKDFNATHTTIKLDLTVVPTNNFVQKFTTAVASGNAPDVASINLIDLPYYASVGVLTNITTLAHSLSYLKDLSPAHLQLATYKGSLDALPFSGDASVLYYNTTLFKQAGLNPNDPPKNFHENPLRRQEDHSAGPRGTTGSTFRASAPVDGFTMYPSIWASGGTILTGAGTAHQTATLTTSKPVAATLTFYHEMWADGLIPSSAQTSSVSTWLTPFESNKVGMEMIGSFAVSELKAVKGLNFLLAPIPGEYGGSSSYAGGDEIGIPRGSKNLAAAETVLRWATSTPAQDDIAQLGVVPTRVSIAKTTIPSSTPGTRSSPKRWRKVPRPGRLSLSH